MTREYRIDLAALALTPGEGRRMEGRLRLDPLLLGGVEHQVESGGVAYRLDLSRTGAGHAFRLRFDATLAGPCARCLVDAEARVSVDAREVDEPRFGDEELTSPYVRDEALDLGSWARDTLILDAPSQILCRPDCAGLCPVCGESLNDADPEKHRHAEPKGPFAHLSDLLSDSE
jgi:DUF177 domain-containing protein